MVEIKQKEPASYFVLLTLDLFSNTNHFIVKTNRKCAKRDMRAKSFTFYINKKSKKGFSFTYFQKENNNHPVLFNCFQMYWTKANNPEVLRPKSTPTKF